MRRELMHAASLRVEGAVEARNGAPAQRYVANLRRDASGGRSGVGPIGTGPQNRYIPDTQRAAHFPNTTIPPPTTTVTTSPSMSMVAAPPQPTPCDIGTP